MTQNRYKIPLICACLALTAALPGCSSTKDLGYAAAAPLRDLNIGTRPVPDRLDSLRNPYGTDTQTSCGAIYREAKAISDAISANNRRYAGTRQDSAMGNVTDVAVESAATYWIPFRGLIRQISGAAGKERRAIAADARGRERLGFLIGRGSALRCPGFDLPAAPMQYQQQQPYHQARPYYAAPQPQPYRPDPRFYRVN